LSQLRDPPSTSTGVPTNAGVFGSFVVVAAVVRKDVESQTGGVRAVEPVARGETYLEYIAPAILIKRE
jgi:hypothetical protein